MAASENSSGVRKVDYCNRVEAARDGVQLAIERNPDAVLIVDDE